MKAPKSVAKVMRRMEKLGKIKDRAIVLYVEKRAELADLFVDYDTQEFIFDDERKNLLKAQTWESTYIDYDMQRLRKILGKERWAKVTRRVLDKTLLEVAYETGEIDPKEIAPAAIKRKSQNIRVSRVRRPKPE